MNTSSLDVFIYVLGTAQDAGYPQVGCKKICCRNAWNNKVAVRLPSCIAIVNKKLKKYWLIDITPEIKAQLHLLDEFDCDLAGIFITHAHSGHYMGLFNLGLEVMNTKSIPVYVMPRMLEFLKSNQITNQLIENNNIKLVELSDNYEITLDLEVSVQPFNVPHRNELSETVGFKISTDTKSLVYLPDIDTWDDWLNNLIDLIENNDILLLDGTFYSKDELKNRDISKIPHPTILNTMNVLNDIGNDSKNKIYFTHLNHTNEVINSNSSGFRNVIDNGFKILEEKNLFYM